MDFITKLPKTEKGFDVIWVIVDRLTKSSHFLVIQESSLTEKFRSPLFQTVMFGLPPFLAKVPSGAGHQATFQYNISSVDRRPE